MAQDYLSCFSFGILLGCVVPVLSGHATIVLRWSLPWLYIVIQLYPLINTINQCKPMIDLYSHTAWWFGTCFFFSLFYGIILPIDFHIYSHCKPCITIYIYTMVYHDNVPINIPFIHLIRIFFCDPFRPFRSPQLHPQFWG